MEKNRNVSINISIIVGSLIICIGIIIGSLILKNANRYVYFKTDSNVYKLDKQTEAIYFRVNSKEKGGYYWNEIYKLIK